MYRAFDGVVVEGKHLGRTLGFPTINIELLEGPLPGRGVYAARAWLEGSEAPAACMLNIGTHPTAPEGPPTIEGHLLDVHGDYYGRRVRVEPVRYLRAERRFASLEALKEQLARDAGQVEACLSEGGHP